MSQGQALAAIEWSPTNVEAYNGQTRTYHSAPTLADVATYLPANVGAIITISRRNSFIKLVRVPDVAKEEARQILQIQAATLFPVPAHELAFDFELTDDVNAEGRLAVISAVRAETLRHVQDELSRVGIKPRRIIPTALGSALFATYFEENDCAVVEHTSEGLAIDIVSAGNLAYARVAPLPRTSEELDAEVCRTFSIAKVPCSKILAAGGLAFEGADRSLQQRSLEVLLAGQDKIGVNLELPEAIAERQRKKIANKMRLALLLWAAVGVAGLLVYMDRADAAKKLRSGDVRAQNEIRKLNSTNAALSSSYASLNATNTTLQRAFQPAQKFGDVMTVVSNLSPRGMWLTGVTIERGREMQIRGTALNNASVSAFIDALSAQSRFRDVDMSFANNATIEDTPVVNFSISARVVGNLPLADAPTNTRRSR